MDGSGAGAPRPREPPCRVERGTVMDFERVNTVVGIVSGLLSCLACLCGLALALCKFSRARLARVGALAAFLACGLGAVTWVVFAPAPPAATGLEGPAGAGDPAAPAHPAPKGCPDACVAYSGDGRLMATANADFTIALVEVASAEQVASLQGHGEPVRVLAFAPGGRLLASGGKRGRVHLWDLDSGREARC